MPTIVVWGFSAHAWVPIIGMWVLTFGIHTFQWGHWYGAIRAVLLIGIAALALMCVRALPTIDGPEPRRWLVGVVTVLLLAHALYLVARLDHLNRFKHLPDIAATTLAAARAAVRGENPYTMAIDYIAIDQVGPAFGGYKYLPVMPFVYAPLGLTIGNAGMLLTNLLLDFVTVASIFVAARRDGGRAAGLIAVALYLSLPLVFGVLYAKAATDLVPVSLLLGSVLASERRPHLAGMLLGLSVSSKLVPGLAALPACIPLRGRGQFGLGLVIGLLPMLLAWFSAPRAFIDNIVRFNTIRTLDWTSWMWNLSPQVIEVSRVALGLVWLTLAVFAIRYATNVTTRSSLIVLLLAPVMLAGPALHQNYNLWWIPFLCIALAVSVVSVIQHVDSEPAANFKAASPRAGRPSQLHQNPERISPTETFERYLSLDAESASPRS
jgi:hypothetical protein